MAGLCAWPRQQCAAARTAAPFPTATADSHVLAFANDSTMLSTTRQKVRAFSDKVDAVLAAANFGEATTRQLDELAIELKLPRVVSEKLCLDGYYGWLSDLSERAMASDKAQLDRCSAARRCFRLDPTAVNELYANTEIDEAVLESMHSAEAFTILQNPQCNFTGSMERDTWKSFRRTVISMVLSTDLARHFSFLKVTC